MDAIRLLKDDHRTVKDLFDKFEAAGERAFKTKRTIVDGIIRELAIHSAIEEELFYPATRQDVEGTDGEILESIEEHHVMKWTLSELDGMDPKDERFDAKVMVLIESTRHHMKEEEEDLFPQVRRSMSRSQLADLGEQMEKAKNAAPTHPHPRSPDEPPGNLIMTPVAAVVDAARDLLKNATGRAKERFREAG